MSILKKAGRILFLPLNLLNKIVSKKKKNVFFYSNLGFRDNVRAVYDYMISNGLNRRYKITVSTDEYKQFCENPPENVKFVSAVGGIIPFIRSKFAFYSFGKYPIKPACGQKVVNLWHGMPLKAVGRLEKGHRNDDQNFFTHIIATSPFFADVMMRAFGASENQIILTSQPRCDAMFEKSQRPSAFLDFQKVIFWMPTFISSKRLGQSDDVYYEEINPYDNVFLERVNSALQKNTALLVIKPHPLDDVTLPRKSFSNICYLDEKDIVKQGLNIYSLLKYSDALVTDFSSIYFDYLMLDRPIAFAGLNEDEYRENRGFAVDNISGLMPGCHINTTEEFLNFVCSVANGEDEYSQKRKECNERCNVFSYGGGCERILKFLGILKSEGN